MNYKYGYFNEDGTEFTVTDPRTPRAFDNFLWNDSIFSNLQQTGVGYADYQIGSNEAIQMFTGVGRICDLDVFGRDHLMSRLIYIRDNETGEYWNINYEPVCKDYESYFCIHGMGHTTIRSNTCGISSEFKVFIPVGSDPVELWTLQTANSSGRKRSLSIFLYNQFQFKYKWNFDGYGDIMYRSTMFDEGLNAIVTKKHPYNRPHDFLIGFLAADHAVTAFDGNREAFTGMYHTLKNPQAVIDGHCTNTAGSSDSNIGAMQFDLTLEDGEEADIKLILGATDNEKNIPGFREKYLKNFDYYFQELKKIKLEMLGKNKITTPDTYFNLLMNGWVKQASTFGATWCRWGWNGYRDIVQHAMGVSALYPEKTRKILLDALKYQYDNGLAIRGWNPIDTKAYSDSAVWLVFTLIAYIKETGDTELLSMDVPYFNAGSGTVLEHIDKALDNFEKNKGSHNLLLIKYGDWNDSLTAVGKEGRGESVWLSEAYAVALDQMAGLMEFIAQKEKQEDYLRRNGLILDAIRTCAWDGQWYIRCFDDNGKPIGSHVNKQGSIFIEAQSWALISGVADEDKTKALLESCDRLLGTDFGYLLLSPTFREIDDNIGRISSLEPGICENGTVYTHPNIWMILGLLQMGMADKAYDILQRITPGYIKNGNELKNNCPPYIYANCYFGPDHRNNKFQMEFTWITGSFSWINTVFLNNMLGAKADYNGLFIDPCLPSQWEHCEVDRYFRKATYHLTINNPNHRQKGETEIFVDGNLLNGKLVPSFQDGKTHQIDVRIL